MLPVVSAAEASRRLELIFSRQAFPPVFSSPSAGNAVAAMVYVDAVVPSGDAAEPGYWARPSTCTWMSDRVLSHVQPDDRIAWRKAALTSRKAVAKLVETTWGDEYVPRYADNSRENLRDETFRGWRENGALRERPGVATTSSRGRWALPADFAALFDPALTGDDLDRAIEAWRDANLAPGPKARALQAAQLAARGHQVTVTLPGGVIRSLEPGEASLILKGVIEAWAPRRLRNPAVLTISEPGDKVSTGDAEVLRRLGIHLDPNRVLPDALIADVGADPVEFWIIEAVATDGPVSEDRRATLVAWADQQDIPTMDCRFLSAFLSRGHQAARKHLRNLAVGTFAWYADEPERELAWYELDEE